MYAVAVVSACFFGGEGMWAEVLLRGFVEFGWVDVGGGRDGVLGAVVVAAMGWGGDCCYCVRAYRAWLGGKMSCCGMPFAFTLVELCVRYLLGWLRLPRTHACS